MPGSKEKQFMSTLCQLFQDSISTTRLVTIHEISDSEVILGERSKINRHSPYRWEKPSKNLTRKSAGTEPTPKHRAYRVSYAGDWLAFNIHYVNAL